MPHRNLSMIKARTTTKRNDNGTKMVTSSYTVLCKRSRAILTKMIDELHNEAHALSLQDTATSASRHYMFGEKESTLSATTKAISLIGKLADIERSVRMDSAEKETGDSHISPENHTMSREDIDMLKRFLNHTVVD